MFRNNPVMNNSLPGKIRLPISISTWGVVIYLVTCTENIRFCHLKRRLG
jgi:hypothetical protein